MKKLVSGGLALHAGVSRVGNYILPRASGCWRQRFQQWHICEQPLAHAEALGQLRGRDSSGGGAGGGRGGWGGDLYCRENSRGSNVPLSIPAK